LPSRRAEERRLRQRAILASGEELEVGRPDRLPLPPEELAQIDRTSRWVTAYFGGGLTAEVFRLEVDGRAYTLKRKRDRILVQNPDGQASFLNEVERRRDFEALKAADAPGYAGIVDTLYASLRRGLILSPWIEGTEIAVYDRQILDGVFFNLIQMELGGVFECDPCAGNLLVGADQRVHLYDFGYAYPFDPRRDFNADGAEEPIFHCAERFETRAFVMHLLDVEAALGRGAALALYRIEKEVAAAHYRRKLAWLEGHGGDPAVRRFVQGFVDLWSEGLRDDASLDQLFALESFRSCLLDVHDDLSGKSCNPDTLLKADRVIEAADRDYAFIRDRGGFFWGDEARPRDALIAHYRELKAQAAAHQLPDLGGYRAWRERRMAQVQRYRSA
jgi:hypothetical protein